MANRHLPEEIITTLHQVDVLVLQGSSVANAIRSIAVIDRRDPDVTNGSYGSAPETGRRP